VRIGIDPSRVKIDDNYASNVSVLIELYQWTKIRNERVIGVFTFHAHTLRVLYSSSPFESPMLDRCSRLMIGFRIIISDTRNSEYVYRMRIMKTWHEAGSTNKIRRIRSFRYSYSFQAILAIAPTTSPLHVWHPDSLRCISAWNWNRTCRSATLNHHLTQTSRLVADCNAPRQLISRIDSWYLMRFNRVNPQTCPIDAADSEPASLLNLEFNARIGAYIRRSRAYRHAFYALRNCADFLVRRTIGGREIARWRERLTTTH
jgi:hypothetical protein